MKTILTIFLFVGLVFSAAAQIDTNKPARFKTKVVVYEGKIGSGVSSASVNPSPEATSPNNEFADTVTSAGHEHELKWKYVGRNGDKDVYHFTFTRMTKAGISGKTTTSKEISFNGSRAAIFEDDLHAVIIEPPDKEDLK